MMLPATGETREIRVGVVLLIPPGTPLLKCPGCGDTYWGPENADRIDALLEKILAG